MDCLVSASFVYKVLWLPKGCDFEAIYRQESKNFPRSSKLVLISEPLLGRYCRQKAFFSFIL